MNKKIEFTKIYPVKSPQRAHSDDAGTDWFIPDATEEFFNDFVEKNKNNEHSISKNEDGDYVITIPAHSQVNIPSGIKVNILDKTTYLEAENKSGVATKYRLVVGAKVVDPGYRGVVHINLINTGNRPVELKTGQKVVQFIHRQFIDTEWSEVSNEAYNSLEQTERGEGGFGSTGIK